MIRCGEVVIPPLFFVFIEKRLGQHWLEIGLF